MKRRLTKWGIKKILLPIRRTIREGISTEKLSVSLALGIILGLIPFYGITTALVGILALSLRLNFISMQVAHFAVHPIQLMLIIPFHKLGDVLIVKEGYSFSLHQYLYLFKNDFWGTLKDFWMLNLSAIAVWFVISIPLFIACYALFKMAIHKLRPMLIRSRN